MSPETYAAATTAAGPDRCAPTGDNAVQATGAGSPPTRPHRPVAIGLLGLPRDSGHHPFSPQGRPAVGRDGRPPFDRRAAGQHAGQHGAMAAPTEHHQARNGHAGHGRQRGARARQGRLPGYAGLNFGAASGLVCAIFLIATCARITGVRGINVAKPFALSLLKGRHSATRPWPRPILVR
jgi:hypothetical protein